MEDPLVIGWWLDNKRDAAFQTQARRPVRRDAAVGQWRRRTDDVTKLSAIMFVHLL